MERHPFGVSYHTHFCVGFDSHRWKFCSKRFHMFFFYAASFIRPVVHVGKVGESTGVRCPNILGSHTSWTLRKVDREYTWAPEAGQW